MPMTPDGSFASPKLDRVMLLFMWAISLQQDRSTPLIAAGMGKPTFPPNQTAILEAISYWNQAMAKATAARALLADHSTAASERIDNIANQHSSISYGYPQGELVYRERMAGALNKWYGEGVDISAENVIFTAGGAGAIHNIFMTINSLKPNGRVLTAFPHYSLYADLNHLHPINVMDQPGYQLTANALEESVLEAIELGKKDGGMPSAFLLCDPNNPLGTVIPRDELMRIANLLRQHPDIMIVLDEAYAEMRLDGMQHCSLLAIAPDLKNRIVVMRSATKALSLAGERMAVTIAFESDFMIKLCENNIRTTGHAPKSAQTAFAEAMSGFDKVERENLVNHYAPQVELASKRLEEMGAQLPDPDYRVEGTFYIVGDFSELLGLPMPEGSDLVFPEKPTHSITDEHAAYSLLFKDNIMIAPLSYFGLEPTMGYMRITCSGGPTELNALMDRLDDRLLFARQYQHKLLRQELGAALGRLSPIFATYRGEKEKQISSIFLPTEGEATLLQLKSLNMQLAAILNEVKDIHDEHVKHAGLEAKFTSTLSSMEFFLNGDEYIQCQKQKNQDLFETFFKMIADNAPDHQSLLTHLQAHTKSLEELQASVDTNLIKLKEVAAKKIQSLFRGNRLRDAVPTAMRNADQQCEKIAALAALIGIKQEKPSGRDNLGWRKFFNAALQSHQKREGSLNNAPFALPLNSSLFTLAKETTDKAAQEESSLASSTSPSKKDTSFA